MYIYICIYIYIYIFCYLFDIFTAPHLEWGAMLLVLYNLQPYVRWFYWSFHIPFLSASFYFIVTFLRTLVEIPQSWRTRVYHIISPIGYIILVITWSLFFKCSVNVSLFLWQAFSSWYFSSWTEGDLHGSGFEFQTAVLSVLCVMFQV